MVSGFKPERVNMTNMNKYLDPCIYALVVDDGKYCYIGSTSKNAQNRLWEHIYRARIGHISPVYEWMRFVGIENVRVEVLERIDDKHQRSAREAQLISELLLAGHELRNQLSRDGVIGSMSSSSRERISAKNKGKKTWISGKTGEDAGWTHERRAAQSARIKKQMGQ
jgi:hypothetical protein